MTSASSTAMPRICMVVQNPYDDDVRVRRKAEGLVAAGYGVDVLALRGSRIETRYTVAGVNVTTLALGKRRGSPARYLFEYAAFFVWALCHLSLRMAARRYAVVEVNTLPDFLIFAAAPARWMGAVLVLDMHEITPEFYMSKYGIAAGARVTRVLRRIEKWSFDYADHVLVIHEPILDLLASRGLDRRKCTVVMNVVDESRFAMTRPGAATPGEVPPARPFVMMYHGTLTEIYGLDVAIEAFALGQRDLSVAEMWILGDGPHRAALERLAAARGVAGQIKFFGAVAAAAVPDRVAQCDLGILSMRRDAFLDYAFPNKLSEYVVLGKPVAVSRLKTIHHYFSEAALAYFEPGHPEELAAQMVRLNRDLELRAALAATAMSEYAPIRWDVMKDRYLALTRRLAGPHPAPTCRSPRRLRRVWRAIRHVTTAPGQ